MGILLWARELVTGLSKLIVALIVLGIVASVIVSASRTCAGDEATTTPQPASRSASERMSSTPRSSPTQRTDSSGSLGRPTSVPRSTLVPKGKWRTTTLIDNLTGQPETVAFLTADWSTGSLFSGLIEEKPAILSLRCYRNETLVGSFTWPGAYIVGDLTKRILEDDNNLPVEYLFDGVAYTDWWIAAGDESVLIPLDKLPVFLDRVSVAEVLGIRVMDVDLSDNDQQARFEVMGIDWALNQLPCASQTSPRLLPTPTKSAASPIPPPTQRLRPALPSTAVPKSLTSTPTPSSTPTTSPGGGWEELLFEDNLTGQLHTGVSLDAVWSVGPVRWMQQDAARIVFRCDQDSALFGYLEWPETSFLFGDPLKENKLPIEYVVDGVKYTGWWSVAHDKAAIIAPEDLQVFLDRLISSSVLGMQFLETDWFDNESQARFETRGIDWALDQLPCSIPPLMTTLSQAKQSLVRVEVHDAAGSGVVISADHKRSLVLTAWHVVESFCGEVGGECVGVSVVYGGERYHGNLSKFNPQEDLAVLDVEGILPVAKLASVVPQIGTDVVTIGLPEGEHDFQFNEGRIVRHSGCSFESCLATNARAWSGFSGGALINLEGELVGVISEGWTGSYYSNAVSADAIQALLQS